MKIYLYGVTIAILITSLIGVVLPALFSAKSTEAVLLGVVVAVVSPMGIAMLAKRLFVLTKTKKEEEK